MPGKKNGFRAPLETVANQKKRKELAEKIEALTLNLNRVRSKNLDRADECISEVIQNLSPENGNESDSEKQG